MPKPAVAKFLAPDYGDTVDCGIPRLHKLAGRYENPMPESTLSPSQGIRIGPRVLSCRAKPNQDVPWALWACGSALVWLLSPPEQLQRKNFICFSKIYLFISLKYLIMDSVVLQIGIFLMPIRILIGTKMMPIHIRTLPKVLHMWKNGIF